MARTLFSIKGTLFTSTSNTERTHGEINDNIRAVEGVVTLNTRTLEGEKTAVVVKIDPTPYGGKFTQEIHDAIIKKIEEVNGVRKFQVYESPFVKPLPKQVPNPVPTAPNKPVAPQRSIVPQKPGYDNRQGNPQNPR